MEEKYKDRITRDERRVVIVLIGRGEARIMTRKNMDNWKVGEADRYEVNSRAGLSELEPYDFCSKLQFQRAGDRFVAQVLATSGCSPVFIDVNARQKRHVGERWKKRNATLQFERRTPVGAEKRGWGREERIVATRLLLRGNVKFFSPERVLHPSARGV